MTVLDDLAALPGRIAQEVAEATAMPRLQAIRDALNASGIRTERRAVTEAPERIDEAQEALRAARVAEADARTALDAEMLAAEWELEANFVTEANRTYLVIEDAERRQMTADERARWKAAEAAKQPAVVEAATRLRSAEHATAAARDALATAERRFSAAKAALGAAVAELQALGIGIAAEPAPTATTNTDNGGNHR
jgi:hypothetical protein